MIWLFWDASALVKRYSLEIGTDIANAIFERSPDMTMMTTVWSCAETVSILMRKHNSGRIDTATFHAALTALRQEIIEDPDMVFLDLDESVVLTSLAPMLRHHLNSVDACLLTAVLRYAAAYPKTKGRLILAAADQRLLRAARAEGIGAWDLESLTFDALERSLNGFQESA